MTENTSTEQTDPTTTDAVATEQTEQAPNREAAKYRTRLRETEAERDTLRQTLATMRRAEVERIASTTLRNPAGLWAAGTELDALLTEAGDVDPEKVQAAASGAIEALGLAPRPDGMIVPAEGNLTRPATTDDMAAVIRG